MCLWSSLVIIFLTWCPGFGWDRVKFRSSSSTGAMLWICDQTSIGNPQFSYCWMMLTQHQSLFLFSHCPTRWAGWGAQEDGRGHTGTADSSWPKGLLRPYDILLSSKSWEEEGAKGGIHRSGIWLSKSLLHGMKSCFPADCEMPAWQ